MERYSFTSLPDPTLLRELHAENARSQAGTARLVALIAEVDERRLYAAAGYPSMHAYCTDVLHMSEDAASRRIRAARLARQFPVIFAMLADGRLHLTALVLLAPYLTPGNAEDLLRAAAHQSRAAIERLLAERFPMPDLPILIQALPGQPDIAPVPCGETSSAPARMVPAPAERSMSAPLSPGRFGLQFTVSEGTYEKLRRAQALLGHDVPGADLAGLFDRALDSLIARLERRKFAATDRPRPRSGQPSRNPRHIPAGVRRAVWQRDGGRCTFIAGSGHRCEARTRLEFDHVEPIARGGRATVQNLRLRCRAHNQYAADQEFGAGYMARKREIARHGVPTRAPGPTAAAERAGAAGECRSEGARARPALDEVVPCLPQLGLRPEQARRAAEACEAVPDAPIEERIRLALQRHGRLRYPGLQPARPAA